MGISLPFTSDIDVLDIKSISNVKEWNISIKDDTHIYKVYYFIVQSPSFNILKKFNTDGT